VLQELWKLELAHLGAAQATQSVHWMSHLKEVAGLGVVAAFSPYAAGGVLIVKEFARRYLKE